MAVNWSRNASVYFPRMSRCWDAESPADASSLLRLESAMNSAPNLPDNRSMMLTIPFVTYGLFRYMYLVHTRNLGENPEDIVITDVPLIISIVLWLAIGAAILVVYRA